jgi:predicted ATPase/DNA-binding winged helix-turn-helix (wHTH) protein
MNAADAMPDGPMHFGPGQRFVLEPMQRRLLVDGEPAALGARAFDLLLVLASQPGRLLSKHALLDAVWPGLVVEENNLPAQISALRKVLGGDIIATIPGHGYRFAATVAPAPAPARAPAVSASLSAAARWDAPNAPDALNAPGAAATDRPSTSGIGPGTEPAAGPPAPPAAPSAPAGAAPLRTNLPRVLPALRGRADDLAALGALIEQHPLVSIVGAGGMGKSLLTQHLLAARHGAYDHGVCWVELAAVVDASALPGAVAAALGLRAGAGDSLASLAAAMAPLRILMALDNAEHLLDAVAPLVDALLDAAPGLRLVVTSQAPLKLPAELVYRIGPLAVPQGPLPAARALDFSAVALFVERAAAADARFVLTDANAPAVIALCRQLDGLALAIELAAARTPTLDVQQMATAMHDRLRLLTTSRNRSAPARQQTLRAALAWSHGLLDERERVVFRRLGVVVGSASLALIQQVAADPPGAGAVDEWAVLDALCTLVDRSLVTVLPGEHEAGSRYRLLESPRLFALEQLHEAGETAALRQRHAQAMADAFEAAYPLRFDGSMGLTAWREWLAPDLDNARAACEQALAAGEVLVALRIGATLLPALPVSLHAEQQALVDRLEPLLHADLPLLLQERMCQGIVSTIGSTQASRGRAAAAMQLRAARALQAQAPDPWVLHRALCNEATALTRAGDHAAAAAALAEAMLCALPAWPPQRRYACAEAQVNLLGAQVDAGAAEAGAELLRLTHQVADLAAAAGADNAGLLGNVVDTQLALGDARAAAATGQALLARLSGSRNDRALALARLNTLAAWLALGDPAQARPLAEAGWPQAPRNDLRPYFGDYLALLAALEGRPRAAARLAGHAAAAYAARDERRQANEAGAFERALALARAAVGEAEVARLQAEGGTLSDEAVAALAFARADAVAPAAGRSGAGDRRQPGRTIVP